jgi:hypothetical protein
LGQSSKPYSATLEARKQGVYSNHADSYVAHIITGRRVLGNMNQFKQYFLGKYTTEGTLVFDEVLFEDIELQYNLYTQQVIVLLETENSEQYVTVTLDKVSRFSIYDHEFTQVQGDGVMAKGIYELAYAGANSSVFIKRTNNKMERIEHGEVKDEYTPINKYYVKNEFGTFHITSKKKLIEAYQNSEQLISILKKNKIKLSKKKMEQGLIAAISYLEASTMHNSS